MKIHKKMKKNLRINNKMHDIIKSHIKKYFQVAQNFMTFMKKERNLNHMLFTPGNKNFQIDKCCGRK